MSAAYHIAFVGGGTVGHIAPLLAVMEAAQTLAKKEGRHLQCSYIGLPSDYDYPVMKETSLTFDRYVVHSGKLHRHLTWNQVRQAIHLLRGMGEAKKILTELRPDLIFSTGGYSTVPVIRAASRMRIPIYCHDANVVAGLANRLASRYAKVIFTTFPVAAYKDIPRSKAVEVGQPVREMFYRQATYLPFIRDKKLNPTIPVITVIGGSQGGRRMNQLVAKAWKTLLPNFQIVQVTGELDHKVFENQRAELPQNLQQNLFIEQFLTDELPALFQKSTVVISRAGGTISELAASRACAILVPLSTSAQDHQMANAQVLEKAGAAVVLDETVATPEQLVATVQRLAQDTRDQTGMRVAIGSFDHRDAAARMAAYLLKEKK